MYGKKKTRELLQITDGGDVSSQVVVMNISNIEETCDAMFDKWWQVDEAGVNVTNPSCVYFDRSNGDWSQKDVMQLHYVFVVICLSLLSYEIKCIFMINHMPVIIDIIKLLLLLHNYVHCLNSNKKTK